MKYSQFTAQAYYAAWAGLRYALQHAGKPGLLHQNKESMQFHFRFYAMQTDWLNIQAKMIFSFYIKLILSWSKFFVPVVSGGVCKLDGGYWAGTMMGDPKWCTTALSLGHKHGHFLSTDTLTKNSRLTYQHCANHRCYQCICTKNMTKCRLNAGLWDRHPGTDNWRVDTRLLIYPLSRRYDILHRAPQECGALICFFYH